MRNRQRASKEEQPTTSKSGGAISNKRVRSSNGHGRAINSEGARNEEERDRQGATRRGKARKNREKEGGKENFIQILQNFF